MTFHLARGYIRQIDLRNTTVSNILLKRNFYNLCRIDVAKDKHDCLITDSDGVVLLKPFTTPNNHFGFDTFLDCLRSCSDNFSNIKVGLEATITTAIIF